MWEDAQGMLKGGGLQQERVMTRDEPLTTPESEGNTPCLIFKDVNSRSGHWKEAMAFAGKHSQLVHSLGRELYNVSFFSCQCRKPTEA